MNANGYGMKNNTKFALFGQLGVLWVHMGVKSRTGGFVVKYGNFGDKIIVFTCMLSSEGCDSFSKHLDLALTSNKTNGGVKKQ